ncbi:MAG TPA: hypothetical protein VHX68_18970 [Planctomycetaceae bacterium]|jgi:hypothetical protein|nr:hypothetical protein [Planctomycetaceae bacterium]
MVDSQRAGDRSSLLLRAVAIALSVTLLAGGGYFSWLFFAPRYSQHTETVLARTNAKGQIVEEFVRLRHEEMRGWFPGAHGLVPWEHDVWFTNHLREPGKPMRELTFLRDVDQAWQLCQPVPDSRQWVVFGQDPQERSNYRLLVFDDTHIVHQLRLEGVAEATGYECRSVLEARNRKFVYLSPRGVEVYDIATDRIEPWTGSFATRQKIDGRYTDVVLHPPFPNLQPNNPARPGRK